MAFPASHCPLDFSTQRPLLIILLGWILSGGEAFWSRPVPVRCYLVCRPTQDRRTCARLVEDYDNEKKLIPENNPTADPDQQSRSGVRYGSVLDSLHVLYPPIDLEKRNALSRSDGFWPFINMGKDPPKHLTYGEYDLLFFAQLMDRALDHYNEDMASWDGKVFTDIGSGTGRLVLAAAALHPWKLCRGLEVLEGIHNVALETLEHCRRTIEKFEIVKSTTDEGTEYTYNESNVHHIDDDDDDDDTGWRPFGTMVGNDEWLNQLQQTFADKKAIEVDGIEHESSKDIVTREEETAEQELSDHYFLPVTGLSGVSEEELELAPVQFICGSFEDPYEYIGDSDLVFVFSSCMSEDMMASLGKAIGRQCKPGAIVITTDYMLPLEGDIEPLEDDETMPSGPYKLDLIESVDGWCWLTGGQSTAHIHRVVKSLWEDGVGARQRPVIPLELQAYRIIKAMEAGELTDSKRFLRQVRNNMVFHGFPQKWLPSLDE